MFRAEDGAYRGEGGLVRFLQRTQPIGHGFAKNLSHRVIGLKLMFFEPCYVATIWEETGKVQKGPGGGWGGVGGPVWGGVVGRGKSGHYN
jgi:hypothetical protein